MSEKKMAVIKLCPKDLCTRELGQDFYPRFKNVRPKGQQQIFDSYG